MSQRFQATKWLWFVVTLYSGPALSPVRCVSVKLPPKTPSTIEAQAKFFQDFFSVQLSPYKIEFGHVCEDPNTWEQRYEKKDYKNHRDMGKVRWGDKKGGYGEHYWDLNHAGHAGNHGGDDYSGSNSDDGSYHDHDHDHGSPSSGSSYDGPSDHSYGSDDYDPEKSSYEESGRAKRAYPRIKAERIQKRHHDEDENEEEEETRPRNRKHKQQVLESKSEEDSYSEEKEDDEEQKVYKKSKRPQRRHKQEEEETTDPPPKESKKKVVLVVQENDNQEKNTYDPNVANNHDNNNRASSREFPAEIHNNNNNRASSREFPAEIHNNNNNNNNNNRASSREFPAEIHTNNNNRQADYTKYVPYEGGAGVRQHQHPEVAVAASVPRLFLEPTTGHVVDRATGQAYVLQPIAALGYN